LSPPDTELAPSLPEGSGSQIMEASAIRDASGIRDASSGAVASVDGVAPAEPTVPRWNVHVRLETSLTYDDNIFIQPRHRESDFYFNITPLIAAGWGQFLADPTTVTGVASRFPQLAARDGTGNLLMLRYAPTAQIFLHRSDQDAVDQDVMVAGRWAASKLAVDAAARFQKLSAPDIDIGNRIESTVTSAFVNANYQMTQKTSLDSRFTLSHDSYQGGLDSTDLNFATLVNYQVLPKTLIGLGAGVGYTTVEDGQDQDYQDALLHLRYEPTFKLSFEGTVGAEFRQISGDTHHITPVFEFAASYAPQDATTIRLSVSRHTEASALYGDQDIDRTTIEASIRQRFFQKVYLSLSGGYQRLDYVDAGTTANRDDDYLYVGVESSMEVTRWVSMRASYRRETNESSNDDFSFRRNVAQFQLNIQF